MKLLEHQRKLSLKQIADAINSDENLIKIYLSKLEKNGYVKSEIEFLPMEEKLVRYYSLNKNF